MKEIHKMLSRYCHCGTEIESGSFHKIEQFYTCTVDKHPHQGVEGKAPRIVSRHQKWGWGKRGEKERNKT
jgi:hypothetical protein